MRLWRTHQRGRDVDGRHHHSRHRQGEAAGGRVVAVGKGETRDDGRLQKLDVKKRDRVLFSKFAGTEVALEDEEHLIIREDDVLGIQE